jgi:hypothetical protein
MFALILTRFVAAVLVALCLTQSVTMLQVDSATAIAAASGISRQVSTQEWLGPLSAIALSPFFGLACLSGIATYGPDSIQSRSALFGESSPLNNPILFWIMAVLTIATSLPRFTKVSKPLGLAIEKLEAYSAIIILISMKFLSGNALNSDSSIALSESVVMTAGIATVPFDVGLSVAAALNIIVVNTIKLAVEVLVWLIPFPTVDAFLELGNKAMCAGLMALYAYSPWLATCLNMCILGVCCLLFFRVKRQLAYMKELMMLPLIRQFMGWQTDKGNFCGFLTTTWNGLPARSAIWITREGTSSQVALLYRGWFSNRSFAGTLDLQNYKSGMMCDQLVVRVEGVDVVFDVPKGLEVRGVDVAAV